MTLRTPRRLPLLRPALHRRDDLRVGGAAAETSRQERWAVSALAQTSQLRLQEAFRNAGLPSPRIAFECRSPRLKLRTVASSDLLDWTSRRFIEQSEFASRVKILPVPELAWTRPIGLIHRQDKYLPPALARFIEILKARAAGVAGTAAGRRR